MKRVEPTTGLINRFRDVIGLASDLKHGFVFKWVMPLCQRHRARIEPAIRHIGNALHRAARAAGAIPRRRINIRTVQIQLAHILAGAFGQFRQRPNNLDLPATFAHPDRDRRAPIAFAADRPVNVVFQPVAKAPVFDMFRHPIDFLIVGDQLIFHRRGADVPRLFGEKQQRRFAAPTKRVGVRNAPSLEQVALFFQILGDFWIGFFEEHASKTEFLKRMQHITGQIHRKQRRQAIFAPDIQIAIRGRDMHNARAINQRYEIIGDDLIGRVQIHRLPIHAHARKQRLIPHTAQFIARPGRQRGAACAQHSVAHRLGQNQPLAVVFDQHIGCVGIHRQRRICGQRPRGRRPSQKRSANEQAGIEDRGSGIGSHILIPDA